MCAALGGRCGGGVGRGAAAAANSVARCRASLDGHGYAFRCSSARRNSEFFFWRVLSSSTSSLWRLAEVGDVNGGVVMCRKGLRGVA